MSSSSPPTAPGSSTASGRLPDFFIVGHSKCGTTALYMMLKSHPQIFMPVKETRFFSPELRSRSRWIAPSGVPSTLAGYMELYAGARPDQVTGEATPEYLRSRTAANRIAQVKPDARIIIVLREPASFLRSFHLQCAYNHIETQKDLRKALALEDDRRRGKRIPRLSQSPATLLYSDHVRYVEQLRRYHEAFSPEQVLVLIYDDFRADNEAVARQVLRFVGTDDTLAMEPYRSETLPRVRIETLHQAARLTGFVRRNRSSMPIVRALSRLVPSEPASRGLRGALRRGWHDLLYTEAPALDEGLALEIRRRFKPEVVALSEYIGRDLVTLWGYDRL
ncbi:MAG TPA: sulfotransferase [Solirubrobacteraceae bacterium]|nr:sulfotransferase [Solirubrobacteraceae bacterium]